jgi:hypothetical protein
LRLSAPLRFIDSNRKDTEKIQEKKSLRFFAPLRFIDSNRKDTEKIQEKKPLRFLAPLRFQNFYRRGTKKKSREIILCDSLRPLVCNHEYLFDEITSTRNKGNQFAAKALGPMQRF